MRDEALLFRLGYFSDQEKARLKEKAVGDICSRFFTIDGEIADEKWMNGPLASICKS